MNSGLFKLNSRDFVNGLVVAVASAVFLTLGNSLSDPNFDFAAYDWGQLFQFAVSAALGYLSKNFATDDKGKLGGVL